MRITVKALWLRTGAGQLAVRRERQTSIHRCERQVDCTVEKQLLGLEVKVVSMVARRSRSASEWKVIAEVDRRVIVPTSLDSFLS